MNLGELASLSLAAIILENFLSETITFPSEDLHYPFLVLMFELCYQNFNFLFVNRINSAF